MRSRPGLVRENPHKGACSDAGATSEKTSQEWRVLANGVVVAPLIPIDGSGRDRQFQGRLNRTGANIPVDQFVWDHRYSEFPTL